MKSLKYLVLLSVFFFCVSFKAYENESRKEILLNVIIQHLNMMHFQPKELNDDFSNKVYSLYIKRIDYNKLFLTEGDIARLVKYKVLIDDQINNRTFEFFDLSEEIILQRTTEVQKYYQEILDESFDFTKNEYIETDFEKSIYSSNSKELNNTWRKYLKYQTLIKLSDLLRIQEKAKVNNDTTVKIKTYTILEKEARDYILKRQDNWFRRLSKLEEDDRFTVYLNSIINIYDPHSQYYPPKDKQDFDIAISGRLEGIGATLTERDGYIKVVRIVTGSACWRQGELKANDIILKVAQGEDEPVDIVDMRLDKAVQLIRGKKGTEVRLTVKKPDASILVIPIIRDIVILEETYAKSVILKNGEKDFLVGYISLPKFYADFKGTGGRSCGADVKKELIKLKKENVDGIILDVRNNSGGSLSDVVKMAGLFIEKGPIVQIKRRNQGVRVLQDKDPKIIYNGPLVIMVNSLSASASEILAAAIQDYKRGIIVGSSSTFGKGTVQRFFELDNSFASNSMRKVGPLGALKITQQKFYRINGSSTQLNGVIPDIILPDQYNYIESGENELTYPLPWDEINPIEYEKWESTTTTDIVQNQSKLRVQTDSIFILIDENARRLKRQQGKTNYALNLEEYQLEQEDFREESKKYKDIKKEISNMEIISLQEDLLEMESDTSKKARFEVWHKALKKDVNLYEAMNVINEIL